MFIHLENLDKPWSWEFLSKNPSITMKDVLENPELPWSWIWLSQNPNITFKDVLENPDKPWCWVWLSWNPNITLKDVLENIDEPRNWDHLSSNKFDYYFIDYEYKHLKHYNKFSWVRKHREKYKYICRELFIRHNIFTDLINENIVTFMY